MTTRTDGGLALALGSAKIFNVSRHSTAASGSVGLQTLRSPFCRRFLALPSFTLQRINISGSRVSFSSPPLSCAPCLCVHNTPKRAGETAEKKKKKKNLNFADEIRALLVFLPLCISSASPKSTRAPLLPDVRRGDERMMGMRCACGRFAGGGDLLRLSPRAGWGILWRRWRMLLGPFADGPLSQGATGV